MKIPKVIKEPSTKLSMILIVILLGIIIIDSYVNPAQYSSAVRGLAIAIGLLAGITVRKP